VELVDESHGTVLPPTFGASLRAARLSRNISLEAVAAHTKINRTFLQDLERNDLSKWPSNQFYRESYLRAYALAIGLNPREVIEGFRRELAAAEASNTAIPSSGPRRLTPVTIPIILAVTFIVFYSLSRWLAPAADAPDTPAAAADEQPAAAVPASVDEVSAPKTGISAPAAQDDATAMPSDAVPPARPAQIEGEIVIESTPPGAHVLVNGINRGPTPVRVRYLPAGSYTIRFIYSGYVSVTRRATISAERPRVQVSAALEPAQPAAE